MGKSHSKFVLCHSDNFEDVISEFVNVLKEEWANMGDREYCWWDQKLIYEGQDFDFASDVSYKQPYSDWPRRATEIFTAGKRRFEEWKDKQETELKKKAQQKKEQEEERARETRKQEYLKLRGEFEDNGDN
jgi:signal transduction histidine kinase